MCLLSLVILLWPIGLACAQEASDPDQPLLAGRLEQIRDAGGNPFFDYQLPAAIIKFKQGFGRPHPFQERQRHRGDPG